MSTHKHIDRLCAAVLALCLLLTIVFINGERLGLRPAASVMGYETRLFDTERVHTIDIVMDDWDSFLETCENEEYAPCAVVIDGEAYKNTGIRAKGNTSLSMVSSMDSDRYSFKLEFDHYESGKTYYGLDKLSLNNIIQDTTYMKDYLTYQMMLSFGVDAPLCSYVYITVNGEDWGLYLAVEGVEDAFLQRNYGSDSGELYKPDSTGLGGGRGNGQAFNMEDVMDAGEEEAGNQFPFPDAPSERFESSNASAPPDGQAGGFHGNQENHEGFDGPGENREINGSPDSFDESREFNDRPGAFNEEEASGEPGEFGGNRGNGGGRGGMGMGSDDVKLKYIDDNPDSYSNIFQNAKTSVTEADQARLIAALKALEEGGDMENVVDIEEVIRYFAVHNFVCNGDSYTGSIVHNYYLYEKDGQLSMIPWDYNLAYGTFQGGSASSAVNDPIDSPVSGGDSRPMLDWIFDSEEYTALYHQYFQDFLETVNFTDLIDRAEELITPYVEKDPTAFYTFEEFQAGVEALRTFCGLRAESVRGQLNGTIPSTSEGQAEDSSSLIDASSLSLSDMGTMSRNGGFGGENGEGEMPGRNGGERSASPDFAQEAASSGQPPEVPGDPDATSPGLPQGERASLNGDGFAGARGGGLPELPNEAGPAVNENMLALAAASLGILFIGLLFALLYQRRKY